MARDEIRTLIAGFNAAKAEDIPGKRGRKKGDININTHLKEILRKRRVQDVLVPTVFKQDGRWSVSIVRKAKAVEAHANDKEYRTKDEYSYRA